MKKMIRAGLCMTMAVSLLMTNTAFAAEGSVPQEKKDTILVQTDANGNITEERSYVTISGQNSAPIQDKTTLTNIKNMSGDETFKDNGDGTIQWENKGNDISYIGTLDADLPVTFKVDYYLDDKKITPEELAGKSGHVKVVYTFENHAAESVEIDGENYNTYVPLLTISSLFLPKENFTNIEAVDGCQTIEEFGDQYYLMGVTAPGSEDAMNFSILGIDEYVTIPTSFGFTADVTNFSMSPTVTCVTPHILDMLDMSNLETKDDVQNQINDLVDATKKLVDGSSQLSDGSGQLSDGAKQFLTGLEEGLTQIANGGADFDKGLDNLEDKKADLQGQATQLLNSLNEIVEKVDEYQLPDVNDIISPELFDAIEQLKTDASALETELTEMQQLVVSAQALVEKVEGPLKQFNTIKEKVDAIDIDKIMDAATKRVSTAAKEVAAEETQNNGIIGKILAKFLTEEKIDSLIQRVIVKSDLSNLDEIKAVKADLEEINTLLGSVEITEDDLNTIEQLKNLNLESITNVVEDMQNQFDILLEAEGKQDDIQALLDSANSFLNEVKSNSGDIEKKSGELASGLDFADSMIKEARSYLGTLDSAVSQAKDGSQQLSDGANRLNDGAKELNSGTEKYYKEGIIPAADFAKQATLKAFIKRGMAHQKSVEKLTNLSGIDSETEGSITFRFYTEAVGQDNQ